MGRSDPDSLAGGEGRGLSLIMFQIGRHILAVAIFLLRRFAGDSITQEGGVKVVNQYRQLPDQEKSQYLTDDHPTAAHLSDLVYHLQIPQLVIPCRLPVPPSLAS